MRTVSVNSSLLRSFLIALLILIFAILSAILCSIINEELYKFCGIITIDNILITNFALLLNRINFDPVLLYSSKYINVTFENLYEKNEIIIQIFYNNNKKLTSLIIYHPNSKHSFIVEPPYNSYTLFIRTNSSKTDMRICVEGVYVYHPYKHLSLISLALFIAGTFLVTYSCVLTIIARLYKN